MEEANGSKHGAVPPLLAEVEVSNLPGFDVTPSPRPQDAVHCSVLLSIWHPLLIALLRILCMSSWFSVVGGAGAAVGQEVTIPAPVPGVGVRYLPGREQPGDPVEDDRDIGVDDVPAREQQGEPGALVRRRGAHVRHHGHLRAQDRLLLRGGAARVLPPHQGQLLLRAVDRLPLPGHRRAAVRGDGPAAVALVRATVLVLELKIYGQWMSGGQRRLSKVANPSNHLSVVGNFVGASMGLREGPIFFSVGLAHYSVLFVTLYQRLPTNVTLPKELHPVFFLFVAAPSVASMAWARITGEFGYGSRVAYFIAMFLYASLAVRINFFRGFRFSLAWWAYTFPMTGAAIASIRYSTEVDNTFTKALCVALSAIAVLTVTALFATTLVHAFVLRKLFPNDISIAITERKMKPIMELHEGDDDHSSGNSKDIEAGVAATTAAVDA